MRKPIIAGNWKMNHNLQEALELAKKLKASIGNIEHTKVIIAPPAIYLSVSYTHLTLPTKRIV